MDEGNPAGAGRDLPRRVRPDCGTRSGGQDPEGTFPPQERRAAVPEAERAVARRAILIAVTAVTSRLVFEPPPST
ncbi:MAG: hypothetical protein ACXVY5_07395 [Gaiellales bacterium]